MKRNLLFSVLASTVLAAAATPASAVDACKNVKFKVTNNHAEGSDIEIRKVKYFNPHTGNTETEDVKNLVCKTGSTCTTGGDNLGNAKNIDLNSIQVVFKHREGDGDWSDEFQTQPFVPAYRKCTENKIYGTIVVGNPS